MKIISNINSYFIQCKALLQKYVNVTQKIHSFCYEDVILCQSQVDLIGFEEKIVSVKVRFVGKCLEMYTYFSVTFTNLPFQIKDFIIGISFFEICLLLFSKYNWCLGIGFRFCYHNIRKSDIWFQHEKETISVFY